MTQKGEGERIEDGSADRCDPVDVARLIAKLRSLLDMDMAALQLAACGQGTVPALRAFLFEREPSGIFEPRCHAVDALANLRAHDVLIEFLKSWRETVDPVERIGDEAVINAAARALRSAKSEKLFQLLLALAAQNPLAGIIETLAAYRRPEALPYLIAALAEDTARHAAEVALREFGADARPALLQIATSPSPSSDYESTSSRRRRRSALRLLFAIGVEPDDWPALQSRIHERDERIAALTCEIGLALKKDCREITQRLIGMISGAEPVLLCALEECLVRHFEVTQEIVIETATRLGAIRDNGHGEIMRSLHRIISQGAHEEGET